MRASDEYSQNAGIRLGTIVDRDPKKYRVKVQFADEDSVVTHWIDVPAKSSTGVSVFQMPGGNDEVWCAMDAKGEGGCLIGSRYNAKDVPPADSNDVATVVFPGGFVQVDTASGNIVAKTPGTFSVDAGGLVTIKAADIALESATLTHNRKNIGFDHGHVSAPPGVSGPPL